MNANMDAFFYAVMFTWFVTTIYWNWYLLEKEQTIKQLRAELATRPPLKEIEALRDQCAAVLKLRPAAAN